MDFKHLTKNLKKDFSKFKKIKIAILADSAAQLLVKAIQGYGFEVGYCFDIFEADYDQIERQIYNTESELFQFDPAFIIVFYSVQKVVKSFYKLDKREKECFADNKIEEIRSQVEFIQRKLTSKVIYFNFPDNNDSVFGNFANKMRYSFLYQVRKINFELMNLSNQNKNLFILDLCALYTHYGLNFCFDSKVYVIADIVFSIDFLPIVAKNICDIFLAILGKFKKCLILDLDNTLWGGVIGDDGIEKINIGSLGIGKAFTDLQIWIKQLEQRGVILAICSKNSEIVAKEPFNKHPEMKLHLEDIAIFVANWGNKADNIRYIQSILNIGFDSMVFVDDNPFERNIVKSNIPEITVPELPDDPSEYLSFLQSLNLFETASLTEEDEYRTKHYQEESRRTEVQKKYINEEDFLSTLNMISVVKVFDTFSIPRVAQLTQRSNQFNLRTVRYTDEEVKNITQNNNYFTLSFSLEDKFGDYGLISVVILNKQFDSLFIDTWIMSCRVLKRNMEHFVLNQIVRLARKNAFDSILGEYVPTPKNNLVKDHFLNLGFIPCLHAENLWQLNVEKFLDLKTYIKLHD